MDSVHHAVQLNLETVICRKPAFPFLAHFYNKSFGATLKVLKVLFQKNLWITSQEDIHILSKCTFVFLPAKLHVVQLSAFTLSMFTAL